MPDFLVRVFREVYNVLKEEKKARKKIMQVPKTASRNREYHRELAKVRTKEKKLQEYEKAREDREAVKIRKQTKKDLRRLNNSIKIEKVPYQQLVVEAEFQFNVEFDNLTNRAKKSVLAAVLRHQHTNYDIVLEKCRSKMLEPEIYYKPVKKNVLDKLNEEYELEYKTGWLMY